MHRLVEYMNKHHIPGGNSFNLVFVNNLMFEMDLTRKELFDLAMDPIIMD